MQNERNMPEKRARDFIRFGKRAQEVGKYDNEEMFDYLDGEIESKSKRGLKRRQISDFIRFGQK